MKKLTARNTLVCFTTRTLTVLLVTTLLALSVHAQNTNTASTPLGMSPGSPSGSYPLSDFESVNLFNGGLNFRLPLLQVGGRGGAGYPITLHVEQKWTVTKHIEPGVGAFYWAEPGWWSEEGGGWRTLDAGRVHIRRGGSTDYYLSCGGYVNTKSLSRITFSAPDGTEYELRDELTGGQPKVPQPCSSGFNRGRNFVTADGTTATFISDFDITDPYWHADDETTIPPAAGYLMLRDGTRFRVENGAIKWMRDRNGNKVEFTHDVYNRVTSIKDSLNRVVTINYSSGTVITFKGLNGATRTIRIGTTTLANALRSGFTLQTSNQLFPELHATSYANNPEVISYIELPDGRRYQLQYNSHAELARVVLPTGGAIEYDYAAGLTDGYASGVFSIGLNKYIYRRVIERRVYPDGGSGAAYATRATYSRPETNTTNSGDVLSDQYNSSGTLLARSQHYFYGSPRASFGQKPTDYPGWQESREYQTDIVDTNGATVLRRVNNTFAQRAAVSWWTGTTVTAPSNDPRLIETVTIIEPSGANLFSKQTFSFDDSVPYNNQNNVKEYDFGSGAPGALLRESRTTFVTASNYTGTAVHLRSLPTQVSIYDVGGVERERSTSEYDNYSTDAGHAVMKDWSTITGVPMSGSDASFNTSYLTRGNATATTQYLLTNGAVTGSVSNYAQYDLAGNVVKAIDARGYATTLDYADCFGGPDGNARLNSQPLELSGVGQASYAFATSATNPLTHTSFTQFDYYLGRTVDAEDANGSVSSGYSINDLLDRPTTIIRAVNTSAQNQTSFSYDDAVRSITISSDLNTNGDGVLVSKVFYDGLGRTTETRAYEGGSNYIATQTQYDSLGRAFKTSNPFRPWQSESPVWTTAGFDALGRMISGTTPDSAVVSTTYSGNTLTVTDQAGKKRKSVTDGLGRLKEVYEDPTASNYLTSYSYDVLNNLTSVSQNVQTRTFVYDSLKRLTSATNPESGTISYLYDSNGNLTRKTDARGYVDYTYDGLNRNVTKNYSDLTPDVAYTYDASGVANSKGRLTSVSSSVSATNYTAYDALGRMTAGNQVTDGQTYSMSYGHNLAGNQNSMTYPSGRMIKTEYDPAGRTAGVRDQQSGIYYAGAAEGDTTNQMKYAPHGAVSVMKLGNGLWEHTTFNNRLQPTQIGLGTSSVDSSTLGLTNTYGTTNNNGNLLSVGYAGGGLSYTQTFGYDELNRLTTSQEGASWSQTNKYDRYGNRWIDLGGGNQSLYFNTANRITNAGYSYDSAGNLINDGIHSYDFDAENKLKSVDGVNDVYCYGADGNRVRKNFAQGEQVRMIYGGGQLLAEYEISNGSLKKEYVYGAKGLIATIEPSAGTKYTTADHLGTPRVVTNSSAGVASRHDYMPFGEELFNGGRTVGMGYGAADGLRQKFTLKERDNETGLDYFGARYYSSAQGRFTSPDVPLMDQWESNPQSWNLYSYVRNNPLKLVDPTGNAAEVTCDKVCQESKKTAEEERKKAEAEGIDTITIEMVDSGVARDGGGPNLTIEEALEQQRDRRTSFIVNNVAAGIGYGLGRVFRGIAGFFRGGSKAIPGTTPGLPASALKPLGRGSTGRTAPSNLPEQLAMEQAMSNPTAGAPVRMSQPMGDPRWPAGDGWIKMSQNINGVEIHYVRNTFTGAVDDFKFK